MNTQKRRDRRITGMYPRYLTGRPHNKTICHYAAGHHMNRTVSRHSSNQQSDTGIYMQVAAAAGNRNTAELIISLYFVRLDRAAALPARSVCPSCLRIIYDGLLLLYFCFFKNCFRTLSRAIGHISVWSRCERRCIKDDNHTMMLKVHVKTPHSASKSVYTSTTIRSRASRPIVHSFVQVYLMSQCTLKLKLKKKHNKMSRPMTAQTDIHVTYNGTST